MKKQPTWTQFREQERAKALKWMFYILYPLALFAALFIYYLRIPSLRWLAVILMACNLVAVGICLGAIGVHIIRFSDTLKVETTRIGLYIPRINSATFISVEGKLTEDEIASLETSLKLAAQEYLADVKTMEGFDVYDTVEQWMKEHEHTFEADFNYEDSRIFIGKGSDV